MKERELSEEGKDGRMEVARKRRRQERRKGSETVTDTSVVYWIGYFTH